jgi:hypothetical protein
MFAFNEQLVGCWRRVSRRMLIATQSEGDEAVARELNPKQTI